MQDVPYSSPDETEQDAAPVESSIAPELLVEIAPSFNYAAWQNAVPLLKGISIVNTHGAEMSSVAVEMNASNGFARDKRWVIDRVAAGENVRLKSLDADIDPAYLDNLD